MNHYPHTHIASQKKEKPGRPRIHHILRGLVGFVFHGVLLEKLWA